LFIVYFSKAGIRIKLVPIAQFLEYI